MPSLFSSSSSTNSTGNTSATTSGSSSSTPTFSAGLQSLMNSLQGYSTQSMQNPMAQLAPIQSAGLDQINQQYATVPNTVSSQLASRGYGSSGLMGNSLTQVANAKAGAQSAFNGQLAGDAVQQSQFGASLANQLLNTGKGVSSTDTSSGTGSSTGTSQSTSTPSILSSLAQMLMLGNSMGNLFSGPGGVVSSPSPFSPAGGFGAAGTPGDGNLMGGVLNNLNSGYNPGGGGTPSSGNGSGYQIGTGYANGSSGSGSGDNGGGGDNGGEDYTGP